MSEFFEIDFLDVESSKSGDAIPLRYQIGNVARIHVIDGGFQDTGDRVVEHIKRFYGSPNRIDAVVVSHPDGDHAGGLRKVLGEFTAGELWMLRPWLYASELIGRFSKYTSIANLTARLREVYSNIAALEEIANQNGVPIREPFQGAQIGLFTVMAPTKARYLDLVVESDKTPEATAGEAASFAPTAAAYLAKAALKVVALVRAAWGAETFPEDDTSPDNNMSVVQYANLCSTRILLTADAGRAALAEAAAYAPYVGLSLPGIGYIQVPHHGSRHNVSTTVLDQWLGPRLATCPNAGQEKFHAVVSAAKKDEDHPRRAVVRAFIHRGARVVTTETDTVCIRHNAPDRGWRPAPALSYPDEQEG